MMTLDQIGFLIGASPERVRYLLRNKHIKSKRRHDIEEYKRKRDERRAAGIWTPTEQEKEDCATMPTDYFGTFSFEEVLLWYDGPMLATVRNRNNYLYLAYCFDVADNDKIIWLVAPISNRKLRGLKSNCIPLLDCLLVVPLYKVEQNWDGTVRAICEIEHATLSPDELPKPGIMLHVTEEDCQEDKS